MKYTIEISPVVYWEGASVSLETEPGETEELAKATKEIYSTVMEALKPMMQQSMMPTSPCQPTCHCTTSEEKPEVTSFKEVEREEKPATKKAKKEKEKDDEDEYI
jgi:hypothetical protein